MAGIFLAYFPPITYFPQTGSPETVGVMSPFLPTLGIPTWQGSCSLF